MSPKALHQKAHASWQAKLVFLRKLKSACKTVAIDLHKILQGWKNTTLPSMKKCGCVTVVLLIKTLGVVLNVLHKIIYTYYLSNSRIIDTLQVSEANFRVYQINVTHNDLDCPLKQLGKLFTLNVFSLKNTSLNHWRPLEVCQINANFSEPPGASWSHLRRTKQSLVIL